MFLLFFSLHLTIKEMFSYDHHDLIGSLMEPVPIINQLQSKFDSAKALDWLFDYFHMSIICSVIYLVLLYSGIKLMENKPAYKLHRPLLMWNVGLAIFSFCGAISLLPYLIHAVIKYGLSFSMCEANGMLNPHIGTWGTIFVFSKVFEFIDTAFLVLRKSSLQFLHWYHHITVLVYSWYVLSHSSIAIGLWFASINYAVHTLMYSYFAIKSAGLYLPSQIALFITILQILQMFIGLFVNFTVFQRSVIQGLYCEVDHMAIYMGFVVYGSYALLFMHFFYNRYIKPKERKV